MKVLSRKKKQKTAALSIFKCQNVIAKSAAMLLIKLRLINECTSTGIIRELEKMSPAAGIAAFPRFRVDAGVVKQNSM